MNICITETDGFKAAIIDSPDLLIRDVPSALDLMASVRYEADCDHIILKKQAVAEEFFILSSGLAGEILQKFVNYHIVLAIVGDFSRYTSKPLKDFIYESNRGNNVFFVSSEEEALEKMKSAEGG